MNKHERIKVISSSLSGLNPGNMTDSMPNQSMVNPLRRLKEPRPQPAVRFPEVSFESGLVS